MDPKASVLPTTPQRLTSSNGRRFLMFDSGTDDHDRIVSTDDSLDAMVRNTNWFVDETFKCAPEIY